MPKCLAATAFLVAAVFATAAIGESGALVIHAGKADGPYHTLAKQLIDAVSEAPALDLTLDLEESQGSVQNIINAVRAERAPVFTAPPGLVQQARKGEKPFEADARYNGIRSLFTIPYQTLHWVVRADTEIRRLTDLAGAPFVPGTRGSLAERQTAEVFKVLDLENKVPMIDIDAAAAVPALAEGKVAGFAMAGAFPLPTLVDLARATPIRLLGLRKDEMFKVLGFDDELVEIVIPKGTYPGIDENVTTVALPVGVYTTERMSGGAAYALTKAFWTHKTALEHDNPPWRATTPETLAALGAKLHPGALRYYAEAGIPVPAALK